MKYELDSETSASKMDRKQFILNTLEEWDRLLEEFEGIEEDDVRKEIEGSQEFKEMLKERKKLTKELEALEKVEMLQGHEEIGQLEPLTNTFQKTTSIDITCPNCGFAKSVPKDKVPSRPVKVSCPQCREGFTYDRVAKLEAIKNRFEIDARFDDVQHKLTKEEWQLWKSEEIDIDEEIEVIRQKLLTAGIVLSNNIGEYGLSERMMRIAPEFRTLESIDEIIKKKIVDDAERAKMIRAEKSKSMILRSAGGVITGLIMLFLSKYGFLAMILGGGVLCLCWWLIVFDIGTEGKRKKESDRNFLIEYANRLASLKQ